MTFQEIIDRLEAKGQGNRYMAKCPAHDDKQASLSVSQAGNGKILLKCHATCPTEQVVSAMGLTMQDLFPEKTKKQRTSKLGPIEAMYNYCDENGALLFQCVRHKPKTFRQRQPDGNGGWIPNINNVRRVLYNLPSVMKADQVVVVEGEKDCDNLQKIGIIATTNAMGAETFSEENAECLRGKNVVIVPDQDKVGLKHGRMVARMLNGRAASIRWLDLPEGIKDASDYLAMFSGESLKQLIDQAAVWVPSPEDAIPTSLSKKDKPKIATGPGRLEEMIEASEKILFQSFRTKYFERSGELVTTAYSRDAEKIEGVNRASESIIIHEASNQTILRDLDKLATFIGQNENGDWTDRRVPNELPSQLHDRIHQESRLVPFPSLSIVTSSPTVLPSGRIHQGMQCSVQPQPGDEKYAIMQTATPLQESVLFVPGQFGQYPTIPENPTRDQAIEAIKQFEDIFAGFPFVDREDGTGPQGLNSASYSAVLAGALSLAARPYLGISAIPLFGCQAPAPRSGKTKIPEATSVAILGHKPTALHYTSEEEFGKHLLPLMRSGDRALLIDNIERALQSSKLCVLLTGGVLRDRVLGESREVRLKNYSVFFVTGNNLAIAGDLSARSLRIDIDARVEKPEARSFEFDPVTRAKERHAELVMAACLAIRAYLLAGTPWNLKRAKWGGFERWDALISGCLTWLGYPDPVLTRDRILTDDPVRASHVDLIEDWWTRYGDTEVSIDEIKENQGAVYEHLCKDGHWDGYHARWTLKRLRGKVVNNKRLVRLEGRSRWMVEEVGLFANAAD